MVLAVVYFDTTDPEGFAEALGGTTGFFENVVGFGGFELRRGIEDPDRFLLTVNWESVDDHANWQKENVSEFLAVLNPYLDGMPDIKHFE